MAAYLTLPTRFAVLVIGILGIVAIIMAPRRGEWLAVMQDEDRQAQVIALLEPRLATEPTDLDLLATLARAYAATSSPQKAIELLERFILLRPEDADAYASLAGLYGKTDNPKRQAALLERSLTIAPRLSTVTELAGVYREQGMADAELALLSRFSSELTLDSGLPVRLAELQADAGDLVGAIRTLERPSVLDGSPKPARNADARILLAKLLFRSGRGTEAVSLGKRWIVEWREPWLDNRLLRSITREAPVPEASELADAVAAAHPEIRFYLAHELADMGAKPVARHLLLGWSTAAPSPSLNEIAGFLSVCRDLDEPSVVWQTFAGVLGHQPAAPDIIARYSDAIAAEFGIGALAPFWASIPRAVIAERPLLAARLAFHEQNLAMAKWLVEQIDPASLSKTERRMWIDLLTAVVPPAQAFTLLHKWRLDGHLRPDLLVEYARIAGSLGMENEYRGALADAHSQ